MAEWLGGLVKWLGGLVKGSTVWRRGSAKWRKVATVPKREFAVRMTDRSDLRSCAVVEIFSKSFMRVPARFELRGGAKSSG
jgi:hypothetical protein